MCIKRKELVNSIPKHHFGPLFLSINTVLFFFFFPVRERWNSVLFRPLWNFHLHHGLVCHRGGVPSPRNSSIRYAFLRGGRVFVAPVFWLREITHFSTSVVRSHWRTAGNVFWVNQWPFHKVLLELKFLLSYQKCPRSCNTEDKRIPMGVSLSPSQLGRVLGTAALAAQVLALTPGKTSWPLFR